LFSKASWPNPKASSLKESSVQHSRPAQNPPYSCNILAINKPSGISSAQVIRNLQHHFNPSALFAPWLATERAFRNEEQSYQRNRRKDKRVQVKIGHGGTLDPMATGVLIMGVGKGTKQLQGFLECSKTYEATMLFGAATDTYDVLGKVLKKAEYAHVTRESVESALERFRGNIMQRPPLYSALRIEGKRLYEYAREGKEVPKEIEERPVEVKELEIVEWLDGGNHSYTCPKEEADEGRKAFARIFHEAVATSENGEGVSTTNGAKRKRTSGDDEDDSALRKKPALTKEVGLEALIDEGLPSPSQPAVDPPKPIDSDDQLSSVQTSPSSKRGPPAVKLRMTVTSGFYVRSLCHELGEAVGSLACMSELVRTRQEKFELGKNVLEYAVLEKGEEAWAPQVEQLLDKSDGSG